MDQVTQLLLLIAAAAVGIVATLFMLRRQRHEREAEGVESRFAVSTEGSKRCPSCGMPNQWTDWSCISCGKTLPG